MADIHKYSNEEITVSWSKSTCIHAAKCARGLPAVFKPRSTPWVDVAAASTDEIIATIKACPSGALQYKDHRTER